MGGAIFLSSVQISSTEPSCQYSLGPGRWKSRGSQFKPASIAGSLSSYSKARLKVQQVQVYRIFPCAALKAAFGSCALAKLHTGLPACQHASFNSPRRGSTVQSAITIRTHSDVVSLSDVSWTAPAEGQRAPTPICWPPEYWQWNLPVSAAAATRAPPDVSTLFFEYRFRVSIVIAS